jgi:HEPN domain-containing protein
VVSTIKNRQAFRRLAITRLEEAKVLLDNHKYSGAYYLCGYALECGLKACISKSIKRTQFPDLEFVKAIWVHKLWQLVKQASLEGDWQKRVNSDKQFAANWGVVKDWDVGSRYERISRKEAIDFFNAVTDPSSGVLQWIKLNW